MLGEFIGAVLTILVRLLCYIALEIALALVVIGGGKRLIRFVRPRADPSELVCAIVGVAFWVTLGVVLYGILQVKAR